ncbi:gemin 2 isoform X2 [Choristoneura fumiferana]
MGTEKKRVIYNARNTENDDEEPSKCFQISPDVEMKEIPITGEEYLLKVIKERQQCAVVTVCDKDVSQFAKNQSRFYKEPAGTKTAPDKLKPTIEWQKIQVSDFSEVRSDLTKILVMLMKTGKMEAKAKPIKIGDDTLEGWKLFFESNDPTLSCALGLKPDKLVRGLEMLVEILEEVEPGQTVDHKTGQWIYAFLARAWQPLLSDTISIMRNLARTCAEIRSKINPDDEDAVMKAAPLNLFICIVARYFQQFDLAD